MVIVAEQYLYLVMGQREEDSRGDTPGRVRQGEGGVGGAEVGEEGEGEGGEEEGEEDTCYGV